MTGMTSGVKISSHLRKCFNTPCQLTAIKNNFHGMLGYYPRAIKLVALWFLASWLPKVVEGGRPTCVSIEKELKTIVDDSDDVQFTLINYMLVGPNQAYMKNMTNWQDRILQD